MKKLFFSALLFFFALIGLARDFTYTYEGQTLTYTVGQEETKTCFIKHAEYNTDAPSNYVKGDLIIPSVAKDGDVEYVVNCIGYAAFRNCDSLTSVVIPSTVTLINGVAFYNCKRLSSLTISDSIAVIGSEAFRGCAALVSLKMPPASFGNKAFADCIGLTEVKFEYSETSIYVDIFNGCSKLKSIICDVTEPPVVSNMKLYGEDGLIPFEGLCDSVKLTIPDESIDDYLSTYWAYFKNIHLTNSGKELRAYSDGQLTYRLYPDDKIPSNRRAEVIKDNYSSLKDVSIPGQIKVQNEVGEETTYIVDAIGFEAFLHCESLISLKVPQGVKKIGKSAFLGCGALSKLDLPTSLTLIDVAAFAYCGSLTVIDIPTSVISIGASAFLSCSSANAVILPQSLTSIGTGAFKSCVELTSVTIPSSITTIENDTFQDCRKLSSLTIPNSVTSIGAYAFFYCESLSSVTIPSSVTWIGYRAFAAYTPKESVVVKSLVPPKIDDCAFENQYTHATLTIPDESLDDYRASYWALFNNFKLAESGVESEIYSDGTLTYRLFPDYMNKGKNCAEVRNGNYSSLTTLSIPEKINVKADEKDVIYTIDALSINALADAKKLTKVHIPESVIRIGDASFAGCYALDRIVLPPSVKSIGDYAFRYCGNLKDINIPSSVGYIGIGAFLLCKSLEKVVIPTSMKTISIGSFKECESLESIIIPSSVDIIDSCAFWGCKNLKEIVIPPSVHTIRYAAFSYDTNISTVIMGGAVENIEDFAFEECPIEEIKIAAKCPPLFPNCAFTNYDLCTVYVPDEKSVETYRYEAANWYLFKDILPMVEPSDIVTSTKSISGKPGDTFYLTATLLPESVTLPHLFWRSTNNDIAIVDHNGVVTLQMPPTSDNMLARENLANQKCSIIVESLYADGPVAEIMVTNNMSGIDDIFGERLTPGDDIDFSKSFEVYNLNGLNVGSSIQNLSSGIYIVRQGQNVKKIAVK